MTSKFRTKKVEVSYGDKKAIRDISLDIEKNIITALIGPSGCGKSTFLRCLNRMNDVIENCSIKGSIHLDEQDIYGPDIDPVELRARVGMVFQKANPFPKSIFDNIAYGPRIHGLASNDSELKDIVHNSLEAIAVSPEVILMDEPCSALDPIATAKIEELMNELCESYTIIIVTHSMQQAARVSKKTAFFHLGDLIEYNDTDKIFTQPENQKTQDYITGRFG